MSDKKVQPYFRLQLYQMMINFQSSFTGRTELAVNW